MTARVVVPVVLLSAVSVAVMTETARAQLRTDRRSADAAVSLAAQDYQVGVDAIRKGAYRKALEAFDGALTEDPGCAKAHDGRGVALALLNRFAESEAEFVEAIRLDSTFAEPRFNLGKLLLQFDRAEDAKRELRAALDLRPDHAPTIALLVDSMLATHDESSAVVSLESLRQRHISHPPRLHLDLASALQDHGALESAVQECVHVFEEDPTPSERREAELALSRLKAKIGR